MPFILFGGGATIYRILNGYLTLMLDLILSTLDFAATQFVLYSPWAKYGPVDADHLVAKGVSYGHWYIYDLQHEFLEVKDGSVQWIAFYSFIILAFATSILGFVAKLVKSFGSEQDQGSAVLAGAVLYSLQAISLVISGGLFHDAMGEWHDSKPELADDTAGYKYWHTFVAPSVLWIVFVHALALALMDGYKLMKQD